MSCFRVLGLIFTLCFFCNKIKAQNIVVDPTKTPVELVKNVLINSSCIDTETVNATGNPTATGQSYAAFSSAGSTFPFANGVVLTTSPSKNAEGPFNQATSVGVKIESWAGDVDLNKAINTTSSTQATVLEFDFTALTNSLSFNYIFASNEYQSYYPCLYSDGFAFLIKESGSTEEYKNLAVLPNSTTAVSATTVHPKIESVIVSGSVKDGCDASNENYFNGYNTATSPINYAGQTVVMNAHTAVVPGKKYHLKLVIADDDTRKYNSAVFIEGGSFVTNINFGENKTVANNSALCFGENYLLDTKLDPAIYTFKWFKKDSSNNYVQIAGATGSSYSVTATGTYKVEANLSSTTCINIGEITIEYMPEIASSDTTFLQCDDNSDGITIFDLTKATNIVKNNVSQISLQGFYESLANAQSKTNPIANPQHYTNKTPNQIVFARIENSINCYKTAQITLQISNHVIPNQAPIATCDEDVLQDGLYQFDLNLQVTPQIMSGLPSGLVIEYYLTASDAVQTVNKLPNIFKNNIPYLQTIYARAVNGSDCYDIVPIELVVNTFDPANFEDEKVFLCKGDQETLEVASGFKSYLWSNGSTSNSILVTAGGDYSVTVTNGDDCQKTKKFNVISSEPAVITGAQVKDFSGIDNSILVEYTGNGDYEFSLNNSDFQNSALFSSVVPGVYRAVARDKNGCGLSNSFLIYVLDYPRFFTPNGDNYNDLWAIKNIDQMPDYTISIFDRYGKLIKQMNQNSAGWNGFFNGQQVPAGDYWFTLLFIDGKSTRGHFSLKR
ncbi:choice-of-anchor L domain-containing protein [Flavobacterium procerum]|uniref:Choice-of-anchor L domain-containing protein n=1 Tax=Flavobacterium procerum TaxID=1455569 RepID=A0ABV6BYB8_9FLAO